MKINVLDKGFVELVDHMGGDLTVVNAARVSYGKRKSIFDEKDAKLIKFLKTHRHTSPFRHVMFQFHVKAPEFVARQWYKHVIGADYTFKDHAWNEISGRYVELPEEFYVPTPLRFAPGSDGDVDALSTSCATEKYQESINTAYEHYRDLLILGVTKELARAALPLSFYTEWYWTASLQAVQHFCELRNSKEAQWEIQQYAQALKELAQPLVPHSWSEDK